MNTVSNVVDLYDLLFEYNSVQDVTSTCTCASCKVIKHTQITKYYGCILNFPIGDYPLGEPIAEIHWNAQHETLSLIPEFIENEQEEIVPVEVQVYKIAAITFERIFNSPPDNSNS
jgi:hypothetical protein